MTCKSIYILASKLENVVMVFAVMVSERIRLHCSTGIALHKNPKLQISAGVSS